MVEMLVVMAIIGILAALLLPALVGGKQRAKRIVCESQLRQTGIAFQNFSHDHNSKFPMEVSTNDGGSREYVLTGNLVDGTFNFGYRHFQPLAGLLENPNILVCPADDRRSAAANFTTLQNSNVSYFVGVNADYSQPMSVLAGDGNLAASSTMVHGAAGGRLTWNREMHVYKGNILFADDHVEEWSDNGGVALGSRSDIVLPSLNNGRSSANQTGQDGGTSQGSGGDTSASAVSNPESAQTTDPSTNRSDGLAPTQAKAVSKASAGRQNITTMAVGQNQMEATDVVAQTVVVVTNFPGGTVSGPKEDDSMMSPFNRELADFLRDLIVGSYLVVLLLILLFAAYRIWCWSQSPQRKRRQ